jgi:hypothetical protein
VPTRSKFISSHAALRARLGSPGFERTGRAHDEGGRPAGRRHIGWRWPCDCSAFARGGEEYIWIPCPRHAERLATS